mmetsp:Transcript_11616/g.31667  ORF Transcript_11616/g.31667 Transcript_11616/m.31667 type:complete len:225 (-) Transcript_11616:681-1355(-)
MASSCLSSLICLSYLRSSSVGSLLSAKESSVVRVRTLDAKRRVLRVSSKCCGSPQILATITVLQFPPKASRSTEVSLDCRKGTCASFLARAVTVCSRNDKDLLMLCASRRVCPVALVFFVRSLPAKSTRFSFASTARSAAASLLRISTCTVNTQWLRLLLLLSTWRDVLRPCSPRKYCASASSSDFTSTNVRPLTYAPLVGSSCTAMPLESPGFSASRSYNCSL